MVGHVLVECENGGYLNALDDGAHHQVSNRSNAKQCLWCVLIGVQARWWRRRRRTTQASCPRPRRSSRLSRSSTPHSPHHTALTPRRSTTRAWRSRRRLAGLCMLMQAVFGRHRVAMATGVAWDTINTQLMRLARADVNLMQLAIDALRALNPDVVCGYCCSFNHFIHLMIGYVLQLIQLLRCAFLILFIIQCHCSRQ